MRRFRVWWPVAVVAAGVGAFAVADSGGGTDREVDALPAVVPLDAAADVALAHNVARPLTAALAGTNAVSRVIGDGLGCDGDTLVRDIHLLLEDDVEPGTFSQLAGDARANLGISETSSSRLDGPRARLEPATSHVTLGNPRGTLQLQLDGGGCPTRNLSVPDRAGTSLGGTGALALVGGTGAYRDATFDGGTWALATATDPGADGAWSLDLAGQVAVLSPGLDVEVLDASWGHAGVDYLNRTVTVRYRITNPGPGDSFGTVLTGATASPGVTVLGVTPQPLGDLLAGDGVDVVVRYRLALLGPPCNLILLGCDFSTTLVVSTPDALDTPGSQQRTVAVSAPDLPPPVED